MADNHPPGDNFPIIHLLPDGYVLRSGRRVVPGSTGAGSSQQVHPSEPLNHTADLALPPLPPRTVIQTAPTSEQEPLVNVEDQGVSAPLHGTQTGNVSQPPLAPMSVPQYVPVQFPPPPIIPTQHTTSPGVVPPGVTDHCMSQPPYFVSVPSAPTFQIDNEALAAALLRQVGAISAGAPVRALTPAQGNVDCDQLREFMGLNPMRFNGEGSPQVAFDWLFTVENIFETITFTEDQQVRYSAHLFSGRALEWWGSIRARMTRPYTWKAFRDSLTARFCTQAFKDKKVREFLDLTQGESMTVEEYYHKFSELARYAPELVTNDYIKGKMFESGLKTEVKNKVKMQQHKEFQSTYESALVAEECENDMKKAQPWKDNKRKGNFEAGPAMGLGNQLGRNAPKKPNIPLTTVIDHGQGRGQIACGFCGKNHSTENCRMRRGACFRCGSSEHRIRDCPQPDTRPAGRGVNPQNQQVPRYNQGNQNQVNRGRFFALAQGAPPTDDTVVTDPAE